MPSTGKVQGDEMIIIDENDPGLSNTSCALAVVPHPNGEWTPSYSSELQSWNYY